MSLYSEARELLRQGQSYQSIAGQLSAQYKKDSTKVLRLLYSISYSEGKRESKQVNSKRVGCKTISKVYGLLKSKEDVLKLGRRLAKEMNIPERVVWKINIRKRRGGGISAKHLFYKINQEHKISVSIPSFEQTFSVKDWPASYKWRLRQYYRRWHLIGAPIRSQGDIKKTMIHELVHCLPEVRAQRIRGRMHPPIFMKKFDEWCEKLLYERR